MTGTGNVSAWELLGVNKPRGEKEQRGNRFLFQPGLRFWPVKRTLLAVMGRKAPPLGSADASNQKQHSPISPLQSFPRRNYISKIYVEDIINFLFPPFPPSC